MRSKRFIVFIVIVAFFSVSIESFAGSICQDLISGNSDEVDTKFLALIDKLLINWPQHKKYKKITSRKEQLESWKDTRQKMIVECAKGDEFGAGFALGEDLAIYKMMLLKMEKEFESIP